QIEQIDGIMRMSYLVPLHDATAEKKIVRERIQGIEQDMPRLGSAAVGPGNYAIGRGYISLHEYQNARDHLEKAWDAGYQLPDVACALGEVLGQLYRIKLDEIGRQSNPELRKIARMQVERQYMAPALQFLRKGAASELSARIYVEGLIAFYSKQYEMAL